MSSFAIFRRSALPRDEPSRLNSGGGGLDQELAKIYELSGYYPAYVRQLTSGPDGRRYFVVPAYGRSEAVVAAHCLAAGKHERRALVEEQRRRLTEPVDCIIEMRGEGCAPSQGCEPFAAIDEGGRVFEADALTREPTIELAPDGVESVRITYRETPAITVPVRENAFVFTSPPPTPHVAAELKRLLPGVVAQQHRVILRWDTIVEETSPTKLEWRDSSGRAISVISAPAAGAGSATSVGSLRAPIGG